MNKKIEVIVGMFIVSALIAGPALAEMGSCPSGHGQDKGKRGGKEAAIERDLGLTPEQAKLLKEAKEAHKAEMAAVFQALKEKRQDLNKALEAPGATRQAVEPIAAEIKALQAQMVDRRIDGILKVKEILTPEQFQKLQAKKDEWKKNGHKKQHKKE